jgi:nicotinate-nucleotide adenylyltransferase
VRQVGLLGGTFDPPHLGHLVVAEAARDRLGLDEVRLLVAGDPWMKDGESSADVRLGLARLAVGDDPHLAVDDRECRRDGPTYTVDTLRELVAEAPDTAFTFLLGTDAATRLWQWRGVDEALRLARFVVVTRPGHRAPALPDGVDLLEVPAVDVSSTWLRQAVAAGRSVRHLVPEAVLRRIAEDGLYRPRDGTRG